MLPLTLTDEDRIPTADLEGVVLACFDADDPRVAVEAACAKHPEHAAKIRRIVARLDSLGLAPGRMADQSSERLGPFEILDRLGEGGMGVVYRARQSAPAREVALKVVRPELLHFSGSHDRFRREVAATAKLSHPGIVPVYEVGESDGVPWFSMALVRGKSLAAVIQAARTDGNRGYLSGQSLLAQLTEAGETTVASSGLERFDGSWVDAVVEIIRQVAIALQHAHERGVLHRDVKPSNIMLTREGRAMLLDFGLALTEDGQQLTATHAALGSLPYMAPEQLRSGSGDISTPQLDVYALGVTLYEAIALENPFVGATREETRERILDARPRPLRKCNRAVSVELATVCAAAMAEERSRRYRTPGEFARDLVNAQRGLAISASPDTPWMRAARFTRRNRLLVGATLAVLFTLLAGTAVSLALFFQSEGLRRDAERSRDAAEWVAYTAQIAGAEEALRSGGVERAIEHLVGTPLSLRGWEWRHLARRLDCSAAVLLQANAPLTHLAASRDGETLLVRSSDGRAFLTTAARPDWYALDVDAVRLVALSADGKRAAWVDAHGFFVMDVDARRAMRCSSGLGKAASAIALSPDGSTAALVTPRGQFAIYDAATSVRSAGGKRVGPLSAVEFSEDGQRLAIAGRREAHVIDSRSGSALHELGGHIGVLRAVAFTPDGNALATGAMDQSVRIWSLPDGDKRGFPLLHASGAPVALAFADDGVELVAAAGESLVRWNTRVGLRDGRLHGHRSKIRDVAWGRRLLSVGDDGTLRAWDPEAAAVPELKAQGRAILDLAVDPTAKLVTSTSADGFTRVTENPSGRIVHETMSHGIHKWREVCWLRDGTRLAFLDRGTLLICDTESWDEIVRLSVRGRGRFSAVAFSNDGRWMATAGSNSVAITIRRTEDQGIVREFPNAGVFGEVSDLDFSPDGGRLAVVGSGLHVLDLQTGEARTPIQASGGRLTDVAFHNDGSLIAVAKGEAILLLDGRGFESVDVLEGHRGVVRTVVFEPRVGGRLLSAGEDGTIRVWDPASGRAVARLVASDAAITALQLSADGSTLVSGDANGMVRTWYAYAAGATPSLQARPEATTATRALRVALRASGRELRLLSNKSGKVARRAQRMLWRDAATGGTLTLGVHSVCIGKASLEIDLTATPGSGTLQLTWNGQPLGDPVDPGVKGPRALPHRFDVVARRDNRLEVRLLRDAGNEPPARAELAIESLSVRPRY